MDVRLRPRISTNYLDDTNSNDDDSEIYRKADEEWIRLQGSGDPKRSRRSVFERRQLLEEIELKMKPYFHPARDGAQPKRPVYASTPLKNFLRQASTITDLSSIHSGSVTMVPNVSNTPPKSVEARRQSGATPDERSRRQSAKGNLTQSNAPPADRLRTCSVDVQTSFPLSASKTNGSGSGRSGKPRSSERSGSRLARKNQSGPFETKLNCKSAAPNVVEARSPKANILEDRRLNGKRKSAPELFRREGYASGRSISKKFEKFMSVEPDTTSHISETKASISRFESNIRNRTNEVVAEIHRELSPTKEIPDESMGKDCTSVTKIPNGNKTIESKTPERNASKSSHKSAARGGKEESRASGLDDLIAEIHEKKKLATSGARREPEPPDEPRAAPKSARDDAFNDLFAMLIERLAAHQRDSGIQSGASDANAPEPRCRACARHAPPERATVCLECLPPCDGFVYENHPPALPEASRKSNGTSPIKNTHGISVGTSPKTSRKSNRTTPTRPEVSRKSNGTSLACPETPRKSVGTSLIKNTHGISIGTCPEASRKSNETTPTRPEASRKSIITSPIKNTHGISVGTCPETSRKSIRTTPACPEASRKRTRTSSIKNTHRISVGTCLEAPRKSIGTSPIENAQMVSVGTSPVWPEVSTKSVGTSPCRERSTASVATSPTWPEASRKSVATSPTWPEASRKSVATSPTMPERSRKSVGTSPGVPEPASRSVGTSARWPETPTIPAPERSRRSSASRIAFEEEGAPMNPCNHNATEPGLEVKKSGRRGRRKSKPTVTSKRRSSRLNKDIDKSTVGRSPRVLLQDEPIVAVVETEEGPAEPIFAVPRAPSVEISSERLASQRFDEFAALSVADISLEWRGLLGQDQPEPAAPVPAPRKNVPAKRAKETSRRATQSRPNTRSKKSVKKSRGVSFLANVSDVNIIPSPPGETRRTGRKREPKRIIPTRSVYQMTYEDVANYYGQVLAASKEAKLVLIERGLLDKNLLLVPQKKLPTVDEEEEDE